MKEENCSLSNELELLKKDNSELRVHMVEQAEKIADLQNNLDNIDKKEAVKKVDDKNEL